MRAEIDNQRIILRDNENGQRIWECGYCGETYNKERGVTTHIGKMHGETKTRKLICPYYPETFHNLANLKQHMLKRSCANKQNDTKEIPWEDIVQHNRKDNERPREEEKNDQERGNFERMEILFGRIGVSNQAEGVVWECNLRDKTADTKEKLRNHLAVMHRKTKIGEVHCPYCEKEHTHIGNLKAHVTGFIGKKCAKIPDNENGLKIWENIIVRNPRQD